MPLPYLLYRAQTRYEDDLRGLQDITARGALSPSTTTRPSEELPFIQETPTFPHQASSRIVGSTRGLSSFIRMAATPLGVRARLNSLGGASSRLTNKASSSTVTIHGPVKKSFTHLGPTSPSSSEGTDSEDEEAAKEEEADRKLEEQEALAKKLKNLQKIITGDALGLVSTPRKRGKGKAPDRGRMSMSIASPNSMHRDDRGGELSSRSQSISSASPHGSIPSIPSPPPESQSPISRHLSPNKSSSPPALSPRSARGQSHLRYAPIRGRASISEQESSNQDSSASSFSDMSGQNLGSLVSSCFELTSYVFSDASLSASALESALMSNIRGGGSRL